MKRTPILRKSPPKKTNPARRRKEFARCYGSKQYVVWCKAQPCIACGVVGFSEVAHIKTGGMGRKDDWVRTVPLCGPRSWYVAFDLIRKTAAGCHRILHAEGASELERVVGKRIDWEAQAQRIQELWLSSCGAPGGQT